MPTTISAGFVGLRENVEISDLQASTVAARQKNVREAVEAHMKVLTSFLAGSYNRDTLISPLKSADVDIFVVLSPEYWSQDGHVAILDKVKTALRKTYKTPNISRNGQAVTIRFSDFTVDVVPCFYRQGGGYLIPDSQMKRWIGTDPKRHIDLWSEANEAHDGDLVPLIKMLKAWNRTHDVMRSFHLEVLTLRVLNGVTISDFSSGTRFVFDKAREWIKVKLPDPAGYSDDIAAHVRTEQEMSAIIGALDRAYTRACDAEQLAATGKVDNAYTKWRLVFGDYFPAYG